MPEYRDVVKHKRNETTGVVIAKYKLDGLTYLDIRSFEERVYYKTPIENWSVIRTEEENYE